DLARVVDVQDLHGPLRDQFFRVGSSGCGRAASYVDQDLLHALGDRGPGKAARTGRAGATESGRPPGVQKQLADRVRDGSMIVGIGEQPGLAVKDGVDSAAEVTGDHRKSVSVGLEKDDSESLTADTARWKARGHREYVGPIEPGVPFGVCRLPDEV